MNDGEILKIIRFLRGFSQYGAGRDIGISQQGFSKWERKETIPAEQSRKLLKALKSSKAEFDLIKNIPPPPR